MILIEAEQKDGLIEISDNQISQEESENDYNKLIKLIRFFEKNIEQNKYNQKQLKIISGCLRNGFQYQESIENFEKRSTIPRTWSDLDQYNMFI